MPESLIDKAAQVIELAKKAGASECFVHTHQSRGVQCKIRDGVLEKLQESTSRSVSIELYVDGRYATHSTTRVDGLDDFIAEAVALTRALEPDPDRALPDPALYGGTRPRGLDLMDPAILALTQQQRVARCQAMNARFKGKQHVISGTSTMFDGHGQFAAVSSNGFQGSYESTYVGNHSSVTMQGRDDKRPEGAMGCSAHQLATLMPPETIGDEALARASARLGSEKGPTLTTTMVVDRMATGAMISRLLGSASGHSVQQGRSMWADKLNKRVLSRKLTIIDDPTLPRGLGSRPFDGEGLTAKVMPVIESGALKNYYLDTYYARKLKMRPTSGGPSNRIVTPGTRGFDEIVKATKKGVYVTSWLGGNADSTTGDFSYGIRGHLIEGGEIGAPVSEMNVTGNLIALFSRLAEVGNDPWTYSSTVVPTLVFSDVQFSGT